MSYFSRLILSAALFLLSVFVFLFSCVVTLSDGQGALIFIFSLPAMAVLLVGAWWLAKSGQHGRLLEALPKSFSVFLILFFTLPFFPYLEKAPKLFLGSVGSAFEAATGKTPYAYFKERSSFGRLLETQLERTGINEIDLATISTPFAWDSVCIFGPYTNNEKAKSVLGLDWKIEEQSKIHFSESVNALVFLFEGKVNKVEDLSRSVAEFSELDRCTEKSQARYRLEVGPSGRRVLRQLKPAKS